MLIGVAVGATAAAAAEPAAACQVAPSTMAVVTAAVDERTLELADGATVRLAGLEGLEPAAVAARAHALLESRVRGRTIALRVLTEDRYGRQVAIVALAGDSVGRPLQEELIAHGYGLVSARVGHSACAAAFLAAERRARRARLGLWADPYYQVHAAERPETLADKRGRFALVQGRVRSVNDRGAIVYVNFGRRWSEDFTVTIARRHVRDFVAAGFAPASLAGRRVRVRGWVDERGGPWIEAVHPEQIEVADRE